MSTKFLLPILLLLSTATQAQHFKKKDGVHLRVVIIRHGEKPDSSDNLNCMGLNRALALPPVLDTVVGRPDHTYVPTIHTGKKTSNVRMFQTVSPFAIQDSLDVNTKYAETDSTGAATEVLKKKGVVLMVWEHHNIPPLGRALVGKTNAGIIPRWKGTDFGSIWIFEFDKKGKLLSFTIEQEGINPSGTCPFP